MRGRCRGVINSTGVLKFQDEQSMDQQYLYPDGYVLDMCPSTAAKGAFIILLDTGRRRGEAFRAVFHGNRQYVVTSSQVPDALRRRAQA